MDWLPIDTAPKDETIILGKLPNGEIRRIKYWSPTKSWSGSWAGDKAWLEFNDTHQPTHWKSIEQSKRK